MDLLFPLRALGKDRMSQPCICESLLCCICVLQAEEEEGKRRKEESGSCSLDSLHEENEGLEGKGRRAEKKNGGHVIRKQ